MADSPNNNTVMQRLLAERYLKKGSNEFPSSPIRKSSSKTDLSQGEVYSNALKTESSYFTNNEILTERNQPNQSIFAPKILQENDPAARLDALCRSTLDKPSNFKGSLQKSGSLDQTKDKLVSVPTNSESPFSQKPPTRSASREVLLRLRKDLEDADIEKFNRQPPTYQEAKAEADHMKMTKAAYCDSTNALVSPRYTSLEAYKAKNNPGSNSFPLLESDLFRKSASRPELQLHGHPKSNSGGDEYLYTDQIRKNNQRRGIRSKKNKNAIGRSSSLRQTPEETIHDIRKTSLNNLSQTTNSHSVNACENAKKPLTFENESILAQTQHSSSRSAPLQNSDEGSFVEQRRSSVHGTLLCLTEDLASNFSTISSSSPQQSQAHSKIDLNKTEMHQNHHELPQGTVSSNQAAYVRGMQGSYGQGPFYGAVNNHSMIGQNTTEANGVNHPSMIKSLGGNSPPRPPPPPYPVKYGEIDTNPGHNTEADSTSWNPQRPKSLALGNCSKRKTALNNGASQNSPCLTSPTSSKCYSPMVRGTPFHSNVKESPYVTPNGHVYVSSTSSPHQKQTSNGSSSYLRRSGSGNNVTSTPMTTPSSSGSSTCTAATTPAYSDPQGFVDPGMRSPVGTGRYPPQGFGMDHYGLGNGVNKSDSMNSASSSTASGGGACRIARRKRNSSSKPGFGSASCSGSSSNSGSRPNSMADLTDRLEQENENLRNCLEVTKQKLKRYETLQVELQIITQSHQALQQTASNRERLESEMRNQLTAELDKTKKERDGLKDEVSTLKEQLKNMSMTSSTNDDLTRVNAVQATSIENRKSLGRERELEEELEERREKISELNVDIELLTSSLHKAQKTITMLKEKFLQTDHVDAYTEQLSKSLVTLQKIVDERQEIEKELKNCLWKQLQSQRPFKSTSSNDEGISEMDTPDPPHSSGADVHNSREGQMLGAKAEMLKWQHRYLEHGLLKHVHSDGSEANQHKRLYKALRNHRHAVSDPGFDKNSLLKTIFNGVDSTNPRVPLYEDATNRGPASSSVADSRIGIESDVRSEKTHFESAFPGPNTTADCACQTPTSGWILGDGDKSDSEKLADDAERNSTKNTSASSGNVVEADSPSEGYHSQQSSGSPTPNVERYSLHFTSLGEHNGVTNLQTRDSHPGVFRRNRSADVLTSSNI